MQIKKKHAKKKHSPIRSFLVLTFFLLLILCFLLLALEQSIRPVALMAASMKSRELCANVMQKTVQESLAQQPELYQSLFAVSQDETGRVSGAVCDPLHMNQLQNAMEAAAGKALASQKEMTFKIPLGTLSGLHVFAGKGPKITVEAMPLSAVGSRVETNFESGGINQTVLCADLVLSVEIGTVLAGAQTRETVECRISVVQLMVVGDTPQFYAQG